ncbi:BACON domain-containing protein [Streptomyces celluloflavus]|uniref:BACON domain-containing protein n=1 Tax=Streptomyces celluloflavus TaxID=58344 RepID=UPI0034606252|nr:sigma-70 family RNA polymerase sigma factor [Streptomyces celluloflavus]
MSSRPEHPTHGTGAHRSRSGAPYRSRPQPQPAGRAARHRRPDRPDPHDGPDRYHLYLDGLFTYCLSVLGDHDAASAVLGEVLALAERHRGRRPAALGLYRPWLYALARWACLRRLAERPGPAAGPARPASRRRRLELSALAWPEAVGTTPEQREALELSVRHRLPAGQVAAVLGAEPAALRTLLAAASCEVERTRAALAVVEYGRCPDVARLADEAPMLLGAVLRRVLVRHVDDCAECRRTAERATAAGPWPGTAPAAHGTLPLVPAPREAVFGALAAARRSRSGRAERVAGAGAAGSGRAVRMRRMSRMSRTNGSPRYDRSGFPLGRAGRAARRARLRGRALTTTVVATVLAAAVPVLWVAYRGAPAADEAGGSPATAAGGPDGGDRAGRRPYENAGSLRPTPTPIPARPPAPGPPDTVGTPAAPARVSGAAGTPVRPLAAGRARRGPGRLTVAAQPSGPATVITLSASGGAPVRWTASADAVWLRLSHTAGKLRPGESSDVRVQVDRDREPAGPWRSRIAIGPGAAAVLMEGRGPAPAPSGPAAPAPVPVRPHTPPAPVPAPTTTGPAAAFAPVGPGWRPFPAGPVR